ncbi:MAG: hypothetical protein IT337_11200 [Thermomicrobiales bacterium]|nr:hypothetical protein [Thermomicrobiales bacterium]
MERDIDAQQSASLLSTTPVSAAATLAAFVDELIPGDELFPPASAVGAQALLADRVRERLGPDAMEALLRALAVDDVSLGDLAPDARRATVARLEIETPALFGFARMAVYLGYYAAPTVTAAIRAMGHDYNDAPQPRGYPLPPFDATPGADAPANPRGGYKRTEDIAPLDQAALVALAVELGLPPKQHPAT